MSVILDYDVIQGPWWRYLLSWVPIRVNIKTVKIKNTKYSKLQEGCQYWWGVYYTHGDNYVIHLVVCVIHAGVLRQELLKQASRSQVLYSKVKFAPLRTFRPIDLMQQKWLTAMIYLYHHFNSYYSCALDIKRTYRKWWLWPFLLQSGPNKNLSLCRSVAPQFFTYNSISFTLVKKKMFAILQYQ